MKKLIQGKFCASFTTHELACDERDISKHKLEIIGRKTVTEASFIDHLPSNLIFVKEFTNELDAVEIFPTQKDIQQLPIRTQLSEIQWSNIRLSGQQLIDGVLHGIIEADIVAYCHIPSKADIVNLDNNQQNKEQIKEFDTLKETPESGIQNPIPSSTLPGCFSFFKTGCLNFLFWICLLFALLYILKQCVNQDFNETKVEKTDNTTDFDTLKIKEQHKDTIHVNEDNTIESIKTVALPNVQFYTNSGDLLPSSKQDLDVLAKYLLENLNARAKIIGHTDNRGVVQNNIILSQKRANTVKEYLIDKGVARQRLQAIGKGSSEPRASNNTAEGRLMNRRVEVKISELKRVKQ